MNIDFQTTIGHSRRAAPFAAALIAGVVVVPALVAQLYFFLPSKSCNSVAGVVSLNVVFNSSLPDDEVLDFLKRHQVVLDVIHTGWDEFHGRCYRYKLLSAAELIADCRQSAMSSIASHPDDIRLVLGLIPTTHSAAEFASSLEQQDEAVDSLFDLAYAEKLKEMTTARTPVIHAVSVLAPWYTVPAIESDRQVKLVEDLSCFWGHSRDPRYWPTNPPRPSIPEAQATISAASADQLYKLSQDLGRPLRSD